jgi:hypothetical protein
MYAYLKAPFLAQCISDTEAKYGISFLTIL